MITPLVLAVVFAPTPDWGAIGMSLDALAAKRGLKPEFKRSVGSLDIDCFYRCDKEVEIDILLGQAPSPDDLPAAKRGYEEGAGGRNPESSPSGVPLGDFCFVFDYKDAETIHLGGENFLVEARLGSRRKGEALNRDRRLLEAMVRTAFAEMVGGTMDDQGKALPVPASPLRRPRRGYRPLTTILAGRTAASRPNEWGDRTTISLGGKTVELALGSDVAVSGGQRFDLGGFVARRNGTWLVPGGPVAEALGLPKVSK